VTLALKPHARAPVTPTSDAEPDAGSANSSSAPDLWRARTRVERRPRPAPRRTSPFRARCGKFGPAPHGGLRPTAFGLPSGSRSPVLGTSAAS